MQIRENVSGTLNLCAIEISGQCQTMFGTCQAGELHNSNTNNLEMAKREEIHPHDRNRRDRILFALHSNKIDSYQQYVTIFCCSFSSRTLRIYLFVHERRYWSCFVFSASNWYLKRTRHLYLNNLSGERAKKTVLRSHETQKWAAGEKMSSKIASELRYRFYAWHESFVPFESGIIWIHCAATCDKLAASFSLSMSMHWTLESWTFFLLSFINFAC